MQMVIVITLSIRRLHIFAQCRLYKVNIGRIL